MNLCKLNRSILLAAAPLAVLLNADSAFAAEPEWWTQQKKLCGLSSTTVYNSWDGKCGGGSSGGGGTRINYQARQQQIVLNAAQQMMPLVQQLVHNALYGDPEEEARRAQEQERIRFLQQQADEDAVRNAERARQRIFAMLKSSDPYQPPALKRDDAVGSAAAAPAMPSIALIKLGESTDRNDAASARAGGGFDTKGPIQGATLPAPPPTPSATAAAGVAPVASSALANAPAAATSSAPSPRAAPNREELLKALQAQLDQRVRDQKFFDDLLAALKRAPKRDVALLADVQGKLDANTRELDVLAEKINTAEQRGASADALLDASGSGGYPRSPAFLKGFEAATQCYSQNAGPACASVSSQQHTACIADYQGGYTTGEKLKQVVMQEAFDTGASAGRAGQLANGPSDTRADGPCRVQWVETYNRGYLQAKNSAAAK